MLKQNYKKNSPFASLEACKAAVGNGCGHGKQVFPDVLQRAAIDFCERFIRTNNRAPKVFEVGAGSGDTALALKEKGAAVTVCDVVDQLSWVVRQLCSRGEMKVHIKPIQKLKPTDVPEIDCAIAKRVLHWLPFNDARQALREIARRMPAESPLLVSIADFRSPLAKGYPFDSNTPLQDRYGPTDKFDGAFGHNATLYSAKEAQALIREAGFTVRNAGMTDWGLTNIQAIRNG